MKKFLAGLLAALMLLSAMPMTSLAAQAEEWTAAVESAVVARETADAPNSFGAAVKNTVQSLGRFLQDTVTRLVQQNLQESSAVAAVFTGAENTAPAANSAGNAVARSATYGDYTYQVLADGTAEITGYTGSATELVIPSEMDGYRVTGIGDNAFFLSTSLKSVTIPDSVTSIGASAFSRCDSLTKIAVDIKNPIYYSENGILFSKDRTTLFKYPNGKIDKSYVIPESVTSIGENAFYDCESLTSITISDNVTNIGDAAFFRCPFLESVIVSDNVTYIGRFAFCLCIRLTNVYYAGTKEEWAQILICGDNEELTNTNIHYNSTLSDSALSTDALSGEALSVALYDKTPLLEGSSRLLVTKPGKINAMLNGVTFTAGSYTETFDKETVLQPSLAGQQAVFTCKGFRDYIVPEKVLSAYFNASLGKQQNLYLEKDQKDGKPYLSTVFARKAGSDGSYIELQSEKLSATDDTQYEVILSANLAGGSSSTYYLSQDDAHKLSSTTGVFPAVKLTETFDPKKDIYAYVQTSSGTSEPVKLKIELSDFALPQNTFSLLGKDGQKIKFDQDTPLVGGAEISLDGFKFPLGIEIEGNRFKISFGMDVFSLKSSDGRKWKNDTWESYKKSVSTIHSSIDDATDKLKEYKKFYETFAPGQSYNSKSKNFDVSFLGYAEGNLVNGKMVFTEFSGEIATKFTFQYTQQGVVWVIPYYAYVNAGASLAAKMNSVRSLPDSDVPFEFGFALKLRPELTIGGGAGVKGAISGGLYGKGSMPMEVNFSNKHTSGALSGEVGVEAELFCFKGKKEILKGKITLWDKYFGNNRSIPQTYANRLQRLEKESGETNTMLIPRDYLKTTSGWLGGRQPLARTRSAMAEGLTMKELQTSVFKNVQTQLISLNDGRMMMAWIEDDANRNTYNRLRLVYSIWENGVWSAPKAVDDDGTNDASPVLATDGEAVFIAWQNLDRRLTEADTDSIGAALENTEIRIAQYNVDTDSFGSKKS